MSNLPAEAKLLSLIEGIKAGNRSAMNDLYLGMYHSLYHYALRRVGVSDAEEVINDAMMVVWKDAIKFEGASKVSTWIFGIVKNLCLKRVQHHSAKKRESVSYVDSADLDDVSDDADVAVSAANLDEIEKLVCRLSDEHRSVITLIAEGMTYQEIAEIEGCPENTAKTRVFHARKILKKQLAEMHSLSNTGSQS